MLIRPLLCDCTKVGKVQSIKRKGLSQIGRIGGKRDGETGKAYSCEYRHHPVADRVGRPASLWQGQSSFNHYYGDIIKEPLNLWFLDNIHGCRNSNIRHAYR
jgi:hypothetical protein